MGMIKEIGGYFEIFTPKNNDVFKNAIGLNCARNCLRYVIRAFDIKEIYLPYYTCPVVWQSAKKENCRIKFYHIDKNFMPVTNFGKDDFVLYTNYFGICARNVKILAQNYKNLIVDNAHAFYMPKYGIASFNSIRKFFAVADGAILHCEKKLEEEYEQDCSFQRYSHLLKRADISTQFGEKDFLKNEESFLNEPIKTVSNLTRKITESFDIQKAKRIRLENFQTLAENLNNTNELKPKLDNDDVPMIYPYLCKNNDIRNNLLKNKIYIDRYWNSMNKESQEYYFQKYLIPLPIDQRYGKEDMEYLLNLIKHS